ncbi:MAG: HypC/HybG/HupF family hydrogenase formation chaperone [Candidatus Verstraetearchaeota archaeon]|nr:HypC/HybG/HupF family hydrogenase formation chaperone [Candidatus Verstraetearchaeota archaeon]
MCLAVPAKVLEIKGDRAVVDFGGVKREISLLLVKREEVREGSYVLVHTGYAIAVLDEEEARETLEIWRELSEQLQEAG